MNGNALILICTAISLLVATARAVDFDGPWRAEFDSQIGVQKYLFKFKTDVEMSDQERQTEFIQGMLTNETASFVMAEA